MERGKKTKHFIEKFYPGAMVSNSSISEIDHRAPEKVEIQQDGMFAFRFFDVAEAVVEGTVLKSDRLNLSGTYYPGGKVYSLAEIKKEFPDKMVLIDNVRINGGDNPRAVRSRVGTWHMLEAGMQIVPPFEKVAE